MATSDVVVVVVVVVVPQTPVEPTIFTALARCLRSNTAGAVSWNCHLWDAAARP